MTPSVRRKRIALLQTGAAVAVTLVVLFLLGDILLTLGLSAVVAYMLLPVVRLLERAMPWRRRHPGLTRTIAVAAIFIAGIAAIAGVLLAVIPPTVREAGEFIDQFPQFFRSARFTVEKWVAVYSDKIPEQIKQDLENALADGGHILVQAAWRGIAKTFGVISGSLSLIVGLATAPIVIYYLLKDSGAIASALCSPFPSGMHPHLKDVLDIANRTFGAYLRGQLTLGLVVGTVVGVGLLLLGVPFAVFLGIVAAITELIPLIGPWIGGAVGVLVTLATEPDKALWVILLYLGVQLLENALLVPRIQGNSLRLHPTVVILIVILASQYFGIWGIILGPPLVAMGRDLLAYFFREWNPPEEDQLVSPEAPGPDGC
jgi:predicted PurR-regulated permease PerM